ncbi:MAG: molybdopterin-dependent oxidoreductase [Alphaproteobacteria bacterium]|nr:molybdopterin-dependent oxidoreductase [Alphaproteobacteria bacterium]
MHRPGDGGLVRVAWDEALALVGEAIGEAGEATSWVVGDHSSLEASWALGHTARTLGSTRLYRRGPAHPAVPLAPLLGAPAATCTLADCIGTDVLLLVGLDPEAAPALARVVAAAKDRGTRVVVVAPELAPALEAAWLPGRPVSAVFGTRLVDDFLPVAPEGTAGAVRGRPGRADHRAHGGRLVRRGPHGRVRRPPACRAARDRHPNGPRARAGRVAHRAPRTGPQHREHLGRRRPSASRSRACTWRAGPWDAR